MPDFTEHDEREAERRRDLPPDEPYLHGELPEDTDAGLAHPVCPDADGRCQYGSDKTCPGIQRAIRRGEL